MTTDYQRQNPGWRTNTLWTCICGNTTTSPNNDGIHPAPLGWFETKRFTLTFPELGLRKSVQMIVCTEACGELWAEKFPDPFVLITESK